jgi:hypothetical protein
MQGELDGHGERVQLPPQYDLPCCPGSITFQHLLDRRGLLSMRVIAWIKAMQGFVQGMQQNSLDVPPIVGTALHHADKVINIHIPPLDRMGTCVQLSRRSRKGAMGWPRHIHR